MEYKGHYSIYKVGLSLGEYRQHAIASELPFCTQSANSDNLAEALLEHKVHSGVVSQEGTYLIVLVYDRGSLQTPAIEAFIRQVVIAPPVLQVRK